MTKRGIVFCYIGIIAAIISAFSLGRAWERKHGAEPRCILVDAASDPLHGAITCDANVVFIDNRTISSQQVEPHWARREGKWLLVWESEEAPRKPMTMRDFK